MNKSSVTTIVIGVVTLAAGFVGGYFVGKKQGETKAAAFFDAKYDELRKKYESKSDEASAATPAPVNEEPKINIVSNNPTAETTGFADTDDTLLSPDGDKYRIIEFSSPLIYKADECIWNSDGSGKAAVLEA